MPTTFRPSETRRTPLDLLAQPQALQCLPSLRVILRELEEKTSYQQVAIHDISSVIRNDQSLSVRILRLANSGYFSLGEPIMDLDEAILYLGLNNVRTIIFTSRCIETTAAMNSPYLSWPEFWKHSAAVAVVTRLLAANLRKDLEPLPPESYYLMGLMHDIGKLAIALLMPRDFENALRVAAAQGRELHSVEGELLGADHAQVGSIYLQRQGVPLPVCEAVKLHHSWRQDTSRSRNAFLLHMADRLVRHLKLGQSGSIQGQGESPLEDPIFNEFLARGWDLPEGSPSARKLVEDELARLPDMVQSITA